MNMEEKMQMWNLGAPDDDNTPIKGGKKCEDANCQLIEPIPEDTPLSINMGHHEVIFKILIRVVHDMLKAVAQIFDFPVLNTQLLFPGFFKTQLPYNIEFCKILN